MNIATDILTEKHSGDSLQRAGSVANVHFTSNTVEWATPQSFFDAQNEVHRFELDVCATDENAKCSRYYTKADDGLKQSWGGQDAG